MLHEGAHGGLATCPSMGEHCDCVSSLVDLGPELQTHTPRCAVGTPVPVQEHTCAHPQSCSSCCLLYLGSSGSNLGAVLASSHPHVACNPSPNIVSSVFTDPDASRIWPLLATPTVTRLGQAHSSVTGLHGRQTVAVKKGNQTRGSSVPISFRGRPQRRAVNG